VKQWRCQEGCPVAELDRQSGERPSAGKYLDEEYVNKTPFRFGYKERSYKQIGKYSGDTGTASRFFYQPEWSNADFAPFVYEAKASTTERNAGVYAEGALCYVLKMRAELGLNAVKLGSLKITPDVYKKRKGRLPKWIKKGSTMIFIANRHPTVKPVGLLAYLMKQFIGKGRRVVDPFVGSGSTLVAGILAGIKVLGIDADPEYCQLANGREKYWTQYKSTYLTTGQIPVVRDAELPLFEDES